MSEFKEEQPVVAIMAPEKFEELAWGYWRVLSSSGCRPFYVSNYKIKAITELFADECSLLIIIGLDGYVAVFLFSPRNPKIRLPFCNGTHVSGGLGGTRTRDKSFADSCLTPWLPGHIYTFPHKLYCYFTISVIT